MPVPKPQAVLLMITTCILAGSALGADAPAGTERGDRMVAGYFRAETAALAARSLADVRTLEDWTSRRDEYRRQLQEMLGLSPLPERTDLKAVVTGRVEHPQFTVEKVQFQSRPGLYVTGNLYVPRGLSRPAPAVLYVCGHGNVKKDGISYGSKANYQHHGAWLARNGFVCMVIDTLQLGEIEGLHHGTYRENMWWWNSRGYTPAGVEAWNSIRALDYLQSRPEVDRERLGITGRSGGGAYSWFTAALDERVQAAIPVAGITDLENHVVDGTVEGHCDCMFMVNTYRWDYAQVAALIAPRALLIANTDKDSIFPLEGVVRVHAKVREIYRLHKATDRLGLLITEGPHRDTQDLQVPTLHWLNRFLKGEDPPVENTAVKFFEPEQLKVYTTPPADQLNTRIHETFVAAAPAPAPPASAAAWTTQRDGWLKELRDRSFAGWPARGGPLALRERFSAARQGIRLRGFEFTSQEHAPDGTRLPLYLAHRDGPDRPDLVVLNVLDEEGWNGLLATMRPGFERELTQDAGGGALPAADAREFEQLKGTLTRFKWAMAYVAPRGVGPTAWDRTPRKQVQNRRRFMLLGQTLDGMRVWDVRRAVQAAREVDTLRDVPLWLQGERSMAGVALYASLFEPEVARLDLWHLPASHQEGPEFLNVRRFMDIPQAVAMAAERSRVRLYQPTANGWEYPAAVAARLGWDAKQIEVRAVPGEQSGR